MMIVASLLMLLASCHGNSKRLFPSKLKDSYLITYSKNEIVVESDDDATHFIYKNVNTLLLLVLTLSYFSQQLKITD